MAGNASSQPRQEVDRRRQGLASQSATVEAQENIAVEVAAKLVKYSDNGTSTFSVNYPEVALPAHPGKHRLLHVHRNLPGVLSEIDRVFSDRHINIAAQYLHTRVGYAVIDIDAEHSDLALPGLVLNGPEP